MVVLTAIGRFFKKIWDWIKNTAWIQPLLIVGIIFGVIFSIPEIVKAINSGTAERNKHQRYYQKFQISLEYDAKDEKGENVSKVDRFTLKLQDMMDGKAGAKEAFKSEFSYLGDKFFVTYVQQECPNCEAARDAFELFASKLNKGDGDKAFVSKSGDLFNMATIFTDEVTNYTTDEETAFVQHLRGNEGFYETVGAYANLTDYAYNGKYNAADLEALETADPDNFSTPTIMLFELNSESVISEVMFGVSGNDFNEKAKTLLNCWNHDKEFSPTPNK